MKGALEIAISRVLSSCELKFSFISIARTLMFNIKYGFGRYFNSLACYLVDRKRLKKRPLSERYFDKHYKASKIPESVVREIKRKTRSKFNPDEKIRIILEGFKGEDRIAAICCREGIVPSLYFQWSKAFLQAGRRRLKGDTLREANSEEVNELRQENKALKWLGCLYHLLRETGHHRQLVPMFSESKYQFAEAGSLYSAKDSKP